MSYDPASVSIGSAAIFDVIAERERQKSVEGWTETHDDEHTLGELADAAAAYAMTPGRKVSRCDSELIWRCLWPFSQEWWKPKGRRRDLVRAAALIIAEIERLDRAAPEHMESPK